MGWVAGVGNCPSDPAQRHQHRNFANKLWNAARFCS